MKNFISIAIMIALQSGKRYTAKELAAKFETSLKTIYRTIDTLLIAGMPIVSIQGKNGGYELMKESMVNASFFTMDELSAFISFIKSNPEKYNCENFSIDDRLSQLCDKNLSEELQTQSQQLVIDTSLWGQNEKSKEKADNFKKYINQRQKLKIDYINLKTNEIEQRVIHPYTLVYKTDSWYIYAYCEKRKSFRLFKMSRISNYKPMNQAYDLKNINTLTKPWNDDFKSNLEEIDIELICSPLILCDIQDWLGTDITIKSLSSSLVQVTGKAYYSYGLIHKVMEFGDKIRIVKPEKLKTSLCTECLNLYNIYNTKNAFIAN